MQTLQTVLIIFTAVTSIAVLIQACVMLGMYLVVRKATDEVHLLSDQLKQHLVPTLSTARNLVEDLSPKVKVAASNLVQATGVVRSQSEHINKTVGHVADLAQAQASRVDEMATAVLDGITQATASVQHGVSAPLKQVSGILNGLRAGVGVLRKKERPVVHIVERDGSNSV